VWIDWLPRAKAHGCCQYFRGAARLSGLTLALFAGGCIDSAPKPLPHDGNKTSNRSSETEIDSLRAQIAANPQSNTTRLRLGELLRSEAPDEAISLLEEIPASAPERTAALQQLAIIHLLANRYESARTALREFVAREPDNFGGQLSLAEAEFNLGKPDAALPHALAAARLAPDRPQTFILIADIHDERQDYPAMIEPLQTALALDPGAYDVHLNLAYACQRTGHLDQAEAEASWCLTHKPDDVSALRIQALVARDRGDFARSRQFLERALVIQPNDVDCRILEADLLLYERQPRQAYDRLREIEDQHRQTVRYLGALARAAASAGERDEAKRLYQAAEDQIAKSRREDEDSSTTAP
jgi:tetratricopeptide (TPR) repeat protein